MDCQAGTTSLEKNAYKPKDNMRTDSDIIMSKAKLMDKIAHGVSNIWVVEYADKRLERLEKN